MDRIMKAGRRFVAREDGAALAEYGILVAFIAIVAIVAVTFFGSVFLLQQVLRSVIGGPNEFAVAGAALVNGLLFQPVRRRIQLVLDRRVRRRTYETAHALAAFQTSLRTDEVGLDALAQRLLATIRDVLHPVQLGLWLRDRDGA